jgi:hypothetical protein
MGFGVIPSLLKANLRFNQYNLYSNRLRLVSESTSVVLVDGTPESVVSQVVHWEGVGSMQYVRPRIQKAFADLNAGLMEDPISIMAFVPFEAMPDEGMILVDVDGAIGVPGLSYRQSRKPANTGGVGVFWELYLGLPSNA